MNKLQPVVQSYRGRQPIFVPPPGATGLTSGSVPSASGQPAIITRDVRAAQRPNAQRNR